MSSSNIRNLLKLTPLLLLASPVIAVGCFSGGQGISAGDAATPITTACNSLGGRTYKGNQAEPDCVNVDGFKINFEVSLASSAGSTFLSVSDCVAQNTDTAAGCGGHGGIRQFGNFQLTFDPNSGSC